VMAIGEQRFRSFLRGAHEMDVHFRDAPMAENLPVLLALIGIWRRNFMNLPSLAIIPYDQRLERFPAFIQQLDMESNGKQVTTNGGDVEMATSPVIWGEPGTNAQHSFFQLLHQGTDIVPVDFIAAVTSHEALKDHHDMLLANCFGQSEALAFGKTIDQVRTEMQSDGLSPDAFERLGRHRVFPGNRPSTTILHTILDPFSLGRLMALYEHKVFVQGIIWSVNSFDQWGVELGKSMARTLLPAVGENKVEGIKNSSTLGLVKHVRAVEKGSNNGGHT